MAYFFEWDPAKADANAGKHGVTFDEASTVFGDPLALLMLDPEHSVNEQRHLLLGMSSQQRLCVVAFAERSPRTRLISARRATPQERRRYEAKG
ncbi:MAG: BrnT family toxin [Candidatus Rokubacteria bacterium]|nr:BrnT family toxin [Candidatus Rokubacteria bacterium]